MSAKGDHNQEKGKNWEGWRIKETTNKIRNIEGKNNH